MRLEPDDVVGGHVGNKTSRTRSICSTRSRASRPAVGPGDAGPTAGLQAPGVGATRRHRRAGGGTHNRPRVFHVTVRVSEELLLAHERS